VVKSSLKNWSPENYLLQIGDGELNGKLVSGNGSFSVSFLRDDLAEAREKQKKEEEAREAARIEREKAVEREKLEAQQAAERANAQAQAALAKQAAKLEQERLEQEAASRLQQVEALKRERAVSGKRNAELGLEFLESNKLQPNVVALPSGLQYKVIRAGSGRIPKNDDSVICRYRGSLIDGKVFDATAEGSTATLKLSSLIAGFREALSLMQIGSKWQVFMPPELAYGSRGVGADIPPNAVLVFDIELVEIATR
jgi:FKBP-type peptidyl-prolyl cis-trans isomerase FklB